MRAAGTSDPCIDIAGIPLMPGREQFALSQVSVDGLEQFGIRNRYIRRCHVGDEVGEVFFTGFCEMNRWLRSTSLSA